MSGIVVKQVFAPMKPNTIRVIVRGNKKTDVFCIEFDIKCSKEIFKKRGIKFPSIFKEWR